MDLGQCSGWQGAPIPHTVKAAYSIVKARTLQDRRRNESLLICTLLVVPRLLLGRNFPPTHAEHEDTACLPLSEEDVALRYSGDPGKFTYDLYSSVNTNEEEFHIGMPVM